MVLHTTVGAGYPVFGYSATYAVTGAGVARTEGAQALYPSTEAGTEATCANPDADVLREPQEKEHYHRSLCHVHWSLVPRPSTTALRVMAADVEQPQQPFEPTVARASRSCEDVSNASGMQLRPHRREHPSWDSRCGSSVRTKR